MLLLLCLLRLLQQADASTQTHATALTTVAAAGDRIICVVLVSTTKASQLSKRPYDDKLNCVDANEVTQTHLSYLRKQLNHSISLCVPFLQSVCKLLDLRLHCSCLLWSSYLANENANRLRMPIDYEDKKQQMDQFRAIKRRLFFVVARYTLLL